MAQRLYQQFQKTLVREVVSIFSRFRILVANEAAPLIPSENQGVKSVVHDGVGGYDVTLGTNQGVDKYSSLLLVKAKAITSGPRPFEDVQVTSNTIDTNGSFKVNFYIAGVPADIPSDTIILLEIKLKNCAG